MRLSDLSNLDAGLLAQLALIGFVLWFIISRAWKAYRTAKEWVGSIVDDRLPAVTEQLKGIDQKLTNLKDYVNTSIQAHEQGNTHADLTRVTGQVVDRLEDHEKRLLALERKRHTKRK